MFSSNRRVARQLWHPLSHAILRSLRHLTSEHQLSVASGDLLILGGRWYVTHTGLLRLARRKHCAGIHVRPVSIFCDAVAHRWAFEATVYKSKTCRGFGGYGDADPSNVSFMVHGAEMRVAETRAVNRALRKAYGIGICSVEEIGSLARQSEPAPEREEAPTSPPTATDTPAPPSATVSTRSFGSMNSIRTSSSPTPPTSAGSRLSVRLRATRSRPSSGTLPTGPRKIAMPCSASSTAIPDRRKVSHETPNRRTSRCRSLRHRPGSGRHLSRSGAAGLLPTASSKTVLHGQHGHS